MPRSAVRVMPSGSATRRQTEHQPVAWPGAEPGADVEAGTDADAEQAADEVGEQRHQRIGGRQRRRPTSITTRPISIALSSVPQPGRSPSGYQSATIRTPVSCDHAVRQANRCGGRSPGGTHPTGGAQLGDEEHRRTEAEQRRPEDAAGEALDEPIVGQREEQRRRHERRRYRGARRRGWWDRYLAAPAARGSRHAGHLRPRRLRAGCAQAAARRGPADTDWDAGRIVRLPVRRARARRRSRSSPGAVDGWSCGPWWSVDVSDLREPGRYARHVAGRWTFRPERGVHDRPTMRTATNSCRTSSTTSRVSAAPGSGTAPIARRRGSATASGATCTAVGTTPRATTASTSATSRTPTS